MKNCGCEFILQRINETRVDTMLSAIQKMWQRFTYHTAVKLEARRQELSNKIEAQWAKEYDKLTGDDAFTTLMQVIRFCGFPCVGPIL